MSFQEFQKKSNRLSPGEIGFLILAFIVLGIVAWVLSVSNDYLATNLPGGGEFYLLRTGGRAFLFDRIEPYGGSVPARVQEQVYGRPAQSGEDVYILDIPFHLFMFFFPLALFPDVQVARAFWMALLEIVLGLTIFFGIRFLDREIPLIFILLIALAGFTSFYGYISLIDGSPVSLLGFAYIGILLALRNDLDELAGALIGLSSYYWEIGAPILLFVLFIVWKQRRWRVLAGAGMLSFILLVLSFFFYSGWLLPFLRASWTSFRFGFGFSILDILSHIWPEYGRSLAWILIAGLIIVLGYEWNAARKAYPQHFIWAACFTLAVTPLLGFHVELEQLVILIIPALFVLVLLRERWRWVGIVLAIIFIVIFFGFPWYLYAYELPWQIGLNKDEFLFLLWPVFTVLGLYWMRWWAVRPPRTWLDRATQPR